MYKLLFLLFFCALIACGEGQKLPFRSGKILSAQVSGKKPEIASDKQKDTPGGVWAELVIQLNPGRKLGSMDYYIEWNGKKYPCRAIARNNDRYDADVWEISDPLDSDKIRMLFNPPRIAEGPVVYEVKFAFRDTLPYPKVPFKDMGSEAFTPASSIPAEGVMGASSVVSAAPASADSAEKEQKEEGAEKKNEASAETKAPQSGKPQNSAGKTPAKTPAKGAAKTSVKAPAKTPAKGAPAPRKSGK